MPSIQGLATVSVRSVQPALVRLRALGIEADAVLSAAGADPVILNDADARIPHELALRVWREAVRRSGDDAFGIHTAEGIRPGAFDILDYAIRSSATLGEGLARLVRYHGILHDAARVRLQLDGSYATLTHALPGDGTGLPRHVAEFIIGGWTVVARQATGVDFAPVEVRFRHGAPPDLTELQRLFRAPIRFDDAVNGLVFRRDMLEMPLVKSDPGLCALLERRVAELAERAPESHVLSERVRQLVAKQLSTGVPGAAATARGLAMSPRSLQRHLRSDGTSYRDLVDALRRDLATRYLSERRIAIAEVAFLLGFSEASAFHRAFKRWTGTTPAEYRRSGRG
jgi:AraC-like DNA-binding protein